MKHTECYIKDYPRPQFVRKNFRLLNGEWSFSFDFKKEGIKNRWYEVFPEGRKINVPYAYNTELSGISDNIRCDRVWYHRKFNIIPGKDRDILLHFEGSDYTTKVWINGKYAGTRSGCAHRLTFNITEFAVEGENTITVAVSDDFSVEKPRGKQRWRKENFMCFYRETTGIYKSVWLEYAPKSRLNDVKITPDASAREVLFEFSYSVPGCETEVSIRFGGKEVFSAKAVDSLKVDLSRGAVFWSAGEPALYDVSFKVFEGGLLCDTVYSYFGLRDITLSNGFVYLNGRKLYQKLILDQGYYKEGLLTPPSEEALYNDIKICMDAGFNGARKHQKVEDERYLYYADVCGFLVWAEMPAYYKQTEKSKNRYRKEWMAAVKQQYNHPSVITWVPFNESWGYGQNLDVCFDEKPYRFGVEIYNLTKKYDRTRPVITNDGWLHTVSDIITVHDYGQDAEKLAAFYTDISAVTEKNNATTNLPSFVEGYFYSGQPVMITEFGGTAFKKDSEGENWGYGSGVKDEKEFLQRFASLVHLWDSLDFCSGYCYTQLSDVEQEVNGLFSFGSEREPKVSLSEIKKILSKRPDLE